MCERMQHTLAQLLRQGLPALSAWHAALVM